MMFAADSHVVLQAVALLMAFSTLAPLRRPQLLHLELRREKAC